MSITEFITRHNLSRSLVISYGGGGNYGDELLLEVLMNLLKKSGVPDVEIAYQQLHRYPTYHRDFGYKLVDLWDRLALLGAIFRSRRIVIGGGGLWGLDMNLSIFIMSLMLWFCRRILGKEVYLLGVGYYTSTNRLGHIGAFFAAKAANVVIARDDETYQNFSRFSRRVTLDRDIVWYSHDLDLSPYKAEAEQLGRRLPIKSGMLFISLRRFQAKYDNNFTGVVERIIKRNPEKTIVVALMEPKDVDPEGYKRINGWEAKYNNVRAIDFAFNPLALLLFFKRHRKELVFIGPQFHGLITAHLSRVPFFPLVYDNKSDVLLKQLGIAPTVSIYDVKPKQVQKFIEGVGES